MDTDISARSIEQDQDSSLSVRVYLLIGLIALLLTAAVGYSTYIGNHTIKVVYPLVNAAHELRLESALGHLWSEEVLLGDPDVSVEEVWKHFNLADWYIQAMLSGGSNESGTFMPVEDDELKALLNETREKLRHCRRITEERLSAIRGSAAGSAIDHKYDAAFNELLASAVKVESKLDTVIDKDMAIFRIIQAGLIACSLMLSMLVGIAIYRFERKRAAYLKMIHQKNLNLDAMNQQLAATEQQMRSSNQQLMASEQHLKATNQQLTASEQQIRASNQQLMASEQALQQSEQRYRSLFQDMAEGVALHRVLYNEQGVAVNYEILAVNRQYETILNVSKNQVIGKPATEVYGTAVPPYLEEFVRVAESGISHRFETYFAPMKKHFDVSVSPHDKNGFATIFTDITERKQAEQKIRMNEARLAILWELSQYRTENIQEMLDYALAKVILLTESTLGYIYHYSEQKEEFILNSWSKEVMKECLISEPQTVYALDKTGIWGEAVRQRKPIILNDYDAPHALKKGYPAGHAHLSRFMTVPIFRGSAIIAVVGLANKYSDYDHSDILQVTLLMDAVWKIIERQQTEDEIEQLELQTQKLESLGILAGGIAHDFNNLLTAIMGNISLAKMNLHENHKAANMLNEAEKASERARALTQQLLTFSKGGNPVKETIAITGIIGESAGFALRGSNIAFELSAPDILWHVDVDPGQMNQVFHNLVLNAAHAMPDGGTIKVLCENLEIAKAYSVPVLKAGRYIKISVQDNGVGIAEEYLAKIFDPYFTTKKRGSGLGLATVYSIVTKHEGHITVESELGAGATFHVYLPASEKKKASQTPAAVPSHPKGSGRVLIMDDEETVRNIAGEILKTFGYEVRYARDGAEALHLYQSAAAENNPFALVIMDLTVPGGMGGKELIKKLLEIDPGAKALVSSGYSNDPVMAEYQKHGFRGFVSKPYNVLSLAEAVKKVIRSS